MRDLRGWLLLTLALLAPVTRGEAQERLTPVAATPIVGHSGPPPRETVAYARLVEMQAVIGWLADPRIFPHPLRARVHDSMLHVHGMVPDDEVRDRVVAIVHRYGKIKVVDHLGRCPSTMPVPEGDASRLREAIHKLLRDDWTHLVHELRIVPDKEGLVTVRGVVPSVEEKLVVSQRLSQLPGVRAVKNELQIWRIESDDGPSVLVSADGRLAVPQRALTSGASMVHTNAFLAQMAPAVELVNSAPLQQAVHTRMPTDVGAPAFVNRSTIVSREVPAPRMQQEFVPLETPNARPPGVLKYLAARWRGVNPAPEEPMRVFPEVKPVATTSPSAIQHVVYRPPVVEPAQEPAPKQYKESTGLSSPAHVEPVPAATEIPVLTEAEVWLQQFIRSICGKDLLALTVDESAPGIMQVAITVADAETGRRLAHLILNRPELGDLRVFLKILIASS